MIIHILFTCDEHKSHSSRCLRGVFTNLEDLENAKEKIIINDVIESDDCFDIVSIEENEFEDNGGYY